MPPQPPAIFAFMPADDTALGGRLQAVFARLSGIFLDSGDAGKNAIERFIAAGVPPEDIYVANPVLVAVVTPYFLAHAGWRVVLKYFLEERRAFGHGSRLLVLTLEDERYALPAGDALTASIAHLPANLRPRYRADMLDGDHGRSIAERLADEIASAVAVTAKSASVVWRKGAAEFIAGAVASIDGGDIVAATYWNGAKQAAIAERNSALTTLDLATLQATRSEAARGAPIHAMAAIPGSSGMLIAQGDTLVLHMIAGGARRRIAHCDGVIRALAVSNDGRIAVAAGDGGQGAAWSLANGACLAEYEVGQSPVLAATFLRDNRTVLIGTAQGEIRAFAGAATKPRFAVKLHAEDVWAIAGSHDDAMFASGGFGGEIAIAAAVDGAERRRMLGHWGPVAGLRFLVGAARASWLVSASHDATLRLWDAATGECLAAIAAPGPVHAIDLCADQAGASLIAAGFVPGEDGTGPSYVATYRITTPQT